MASTLEPSTPIANLFPEFTCCGGKLRLVLHYYEDGESWEARCPCCGRVWWIECLGVESEIYKKDEEELRVKVPNH